MEAVSQNSEQMGANIVATLEALIAELRASETRYASLIHNSPDGVLVLDQNGVILFANPAAAAMFGYPVERLTGRSFGFPVVKGEAAEIDLVTLNGARVAEMRVVETVWHGQAAYLALLHDITEHKSLQRLLSQTNAELEERVAARTAELEATVADLNRANAGKDAFMAAISHELRTPLTGVLSMSELLQSQARGELNSDQQRYVTSIREAGERLLETVNSVLRYTSLVARSTPLPQEPCRLHELCAIAVRKVEERAARRRQHIQLSVHPNDIEVYAHPDSIISLLVVLLDNAVKFSPEGGELGVEVTALEDARVRLVVWDNGIGIPKDQLDYLFQPLTQADEGLSRRFSGIGLGLAYVGKVVELLDGAIEVESESGRGSRFVVTVPLHSRPK